jgi:hypothetical protein
MDELLIMEHKINIITNTFKMKTSSTKTETKSMVSVLATGPTGPMLRVPAWLRAVDFYG